MIPAFAESAGEAIASNCRGYEIAGGVTLLLLSLFIGISLLFIYLAIRSRCIYWEHVSLPPSHLPCPFSPAG